MRTKPRFVTLDTTLFANGQTVVFDEATNSFKAGVFTPAAPENWATAPTTTTEAINRIAAEVAVLKGSAIS